MVQGTISAHPPYQLNRYVRLQVLLCNFPITCRICLIQTQLSNVFHPWFQMDVLRGSAI
jgi:hypothetical protein